MSVLSHCSCFMTIVTLFEIKSAVTLDNFWEIVSLPLSNYTWFFGCDDFE